MSSSSVVHEVRQGECLASIAFAYGVPADLIRDDPANQDLWENRVGGYVLMPGDLLTVPARRERVELCKTGKRHVFRRKGVPETFKLQLLLYGEPRAGLAYTLEIVGTTFSGVTDEEGRLSHPIPPNAAEGVLRIGDAEEYPLRLGHLDPVTTDQGRRARLVNLGYLADPEATAEVVTAALRLFQEDHLLDPDGEPTPETMAKLTEIHGS